MNQHLQDACAKSGLDLTPDAQRFLEFLLKELRPLWKSYEEEYVMEVVFALASLPYVAPKIETHILENKAKNLKLLEIAESFQSVVNMLLSPKEKIWLTLRYIDAYEVPA